MSFVKEIDALIGWKMLVSLYRWGSILMFRCRMNDFQQVLIDDIMGVS